MSDDDLIATAKTAAQHENNPATAILLAMLAERINELKEG